MKRRPKATMIIAMVQKTPKKKPEDKSIHLSFLKTVEASRSLPLLPGVSE